MPRLQLDDVELYFESSGQGVPLLLIHGLGASTRDWKHQISRFSDRFRVLTIDLRGHGQSSKPPGPYSIAQFSRDIAALLRAVGASAAHVVGHSLGGMIAFELAVSEPEMIRSLIVVNSGPEIPMNKLSERMRVYLNIFLRRTVVHTMGMRQLGKILGKKLFPNSDQRDLRESFVERWAENDKRAYLDSLAAALDWSVSSDLQNITCPTLIVASDNDYTSLEFKKAYTEKIPIAQLVVIPDSLHFVTLDQPGCFNRAVMSFLTTHQ